MRYHFERPARIVTQMYGETYRIDHPVYDAATLYLDSGRGLCVIQQYYDTERKTTYWAELNPWLVDVLYLQKDFDKYFNENASVKDPDGFYPTVTVRKLMWALRMKPLKKQIWETTFDRQFI